jgi:glyoxylase-like metal-dependent hydrolase (beta-lactamase superfamily II)
MSLSFNRELDFTYGRVAVLTPTIRRVVAENPGPFTFKGTGTYIIGRSEVAVIDPGPYDEAHFAALMNALKGETVTHILVTHTHRDHSPGVKLLQPATGAPTYGYGPHGGDKGLPHVEEGGDFDFKPDVVVKDGDVIRGRDWTVQAVHTPGHTSNHLCFAFREEDVLFSGDHVMGWSTTVVSQPDGDMGAYMRSLEKLLQRDEAAYWPTHGAAITDPKAHVAGLIAHRRHREDQIAACIKDGRTTIPEMVEAMYIGLDPRLIGGARRSVQSHLIHMIEAGQIASAGEPTLDAVYSLAR